MHCTERTLMTLGLSRRARGAIAAFGIVIATVLVLPVGASARVGDDPMDRHKTDYEACLEIQKVFDNDVFELADVAGKLAIAKNKPPGSVRDAEVKALEKRLTMLNDLITHWLAEWSRRCKQFGKIIKVNGASCQAENKGGEEVPVGYSTNEWGTDPARYGRYGSRA